MQTKSMESTDPLSELKREYLSQTTAPLDGMWLDGFVPMAHHFGFYDGQALVGFFCVNEEGYLLQFFLNRENQHRSASLFAEVSGDSSPAGQVRGAVVSTAEPHFLSLCVDQFKDFEVNSLMYQHDGLKAASEQPRDASLELAGVDSAQLEQAVEFAVDSVGAPAEWLNGYYANLIDRRELFGVWDSGRLIATGESRLSDQFDQEHADVGVIVAESERGKGIATHVLKQLVAMNESKRVHSICSTEQGNVGAQTAIVRAGFHATNRILQFHRRALTG